MKDQIKLQPTASPSLRLQKIYIRVDEYCFFFLFQCWKHDSYSYKVNFQCLWFGGFKFHHLATIVFPIICDGTIMLVRTPFQNYFHHWLWKQLSSVSLQVHTARFASSVYCKNHCSKVLIIHLYVIGQWVCLLNYFTLCFIVNDKMTFLIIAN